jgi:hypothetical protein
MQNSELTNGCLGLPIEILEDIIARVLGSHLPFGNTSPRAPITVLDHEHLIPFQERIHAYMLIATVCRLWHELAGAEFYRSCEISRSFHWPSQARSLIVNRHCIYRLKVSMWIGSSYRADDEHRQMTLVLEAIGAPIGKTILSTTATLPSNLRELVITHTSSIRWRSVIEAIASLNNLEILGLHNIGFFVDDSSKNTVVLPPRLTTLDIRLCEFSTFGGTTPFYPTFMDSLSIINLRLRTQLNFNGRNALIEVLEVLGKRLVHLDTDIGFHTESDIHSPFILPKLRYLELKFPIK